MSLGPGGIQDVGMRVSESTYTGTWQSHAVNFSVAGTVPVLGVAGHGREHFHLPPIGD